MPRKIKVGLAGLGSIAQRGILPHTFQADAREKIEAVAVCDPIPGRAQATAEKWSWREAYTDYDEMLAKADVECVLIASPIPYHYRQVMAALEAGKHVYVQKSMTTTLAEANDVVETARAKGLKLCASPGHMLNPTSQKMKQLISDGALGKIYWAFSSNPGLGHEHEPLRGGAGTLAAIDPTWYYKQGGGPVYDMTVYSLHTLTGILGPVKKVTALSGIGLKERTWRDKVIPVEMDDNTLMLMDFGNSTFAVATGNNCMSSASIGWKIGFFGTAGTIEMGGQSGIEITSQTAIPEVLGFASPTIRATPPRGLPGVVGRHLSIPEPHVYADIMHLVECIVEDRQPVPSGEHARHVVELIEKAYESSRTGQALELTTTF